METTFHMPVLVKEVLRSLACKPGGIYVDGTVGGGGHAEGILRETFPDGILVGIDKDDVAIQASRERLKDFGDRVTLMKGSFADMASILKGLNISRADGIILDLGVSSHQLNTADRGFSFSSDAPLDMRMDQNGSIRAADLVNELSEGELERVIREYGEDFRAKKIARAIAARRRTAPIMTTGELAAVVAGAVKGRRRHERIHPATKTFQALRIAVNDEMSNLRRVLDTGVDLLAVGGRFSIISFHSLEDRMVKQAFRAWEKGCVCPPEFPHCVCGEKQKVVVITKRAVKPSDDEITSNPRSRSARLRTAERV
ncbi:MAG: 16S rRNA (cytosine(1402)-N(4))-methyltransferase RsmH [Deltaproteobacteria bacterium]|nr:16S rRNA (cytosine(1402)-N(4))-methyltransferase RsmH [Deltaproteobacteria bacterium]MBN2687341.1 16S rRNA (cytosine(1402)-N(4))-methyltransferase RsmH [Deltaproteobacteria bacterium]